MAKPLHALLDGFVEQFAGLIAARAEQMFLRSAQRTGVGAVRICPYPGCTMPGAGPRNRWFCSDHSRSVPVQEQKRLLAERRREKRLAARLARGGRTHDMRCRVALCKNMSRGPRFGYICDKHRKQLTAKEQREARKKWNMSRALARLPRPSPSIEDRRGEAREDGR